MEWAPLLVFHLCLFSLLGGGDSPLLDTNQVSLIHLCFPGCFQLLVHLLQFQQVGYYPEEEPIFSVRLSPTFCLT